MLNVLFMFLLVLAILGIVIGTPLLVLKLLSNRMESKSKIHEQEFLKKHNIHITEYNKGE